MKKINIAQIGIGYWGPNLLRNFYSNPNVKLKILVDKSPKVLEKLKNQYPDILVSDDPNTIYNDPTIDAVIISTPAFTHHELSIKALNSKKHIFVEKPLAMNIEEVIDIERIALKNNRKVMVGHTFIYNNAVRYIKKLIESEEIGDIRYIYAQRVNLGKIRSDVNAMWNLAPHDLSIIQYWLNNIECKKINYFGMDYTQDGIDDVSFINIEYPNKILANVHVSWLDPIKIRKVTVIGSKKMVVYDDISENKVTIYDKGIDLDENINKGTSNYQSDYSLYKNANFNHRFGDIIIPKIDWVEPLKIETEHFIDCIINDKEPLTNIDHAKEVIRILEYANKNV